MKTSIILFHLLIAVWFFSGCDGCNGPNGEREIEMTERYSTQDEFLNSMKRVESHLQAKRLVAYLDTLENGEPDTLGEKLPLEEFVGGIIQKIEEGDLASAVYDVYRFDGTPFSLISFLMKAERVGDITPTTLLEITDEIPIPPVRDTSFSPPLTPVVEDPPPPCPCQPEVKIIVTWEYRPECGNYTETYTGYAANNTLTGMRRFALFRLEAEVHGCGEPGSWSNTINCATNISCRSRSDNEVSVIAGDAGTVTVTFTYLCNCIHQCGRAADATFTLNFR